MIEKSAALLVMLSGMALIIVFTLKWFGWSKVKHWPRVPGLLLATDYHIGQRPTRSSGLVSVYTPLVKYEYVVNGVKYIGRGITVYDKRLSTEEFDKAREVLEEISKTPDVYYCPGNPGKSKLINKLQWCHFDYVLTYIVLGILLAAIGGALFYFSFKF